VSDKRAPGSDLQDPVIRAMASFAALFCLAVFGVAAVETGAFDPVSFTVGVVITPLVVRGFRWLSEPEKASQPAWAGSQSGQVAFFVWTVSVIVAARVVFTTLVPPWIVPGVLWTVVGIAGTSLCYVLGRTVLTVGRA